MEIRTEKKRWRITQFVICDQCGAKLSGHRGIQVCRGRIGEPPDIYNYCNKECRLIGEVREIKDR